MVLNFLIQYALPLWSLVTEALMHIKTRVGLYMTIENFAIWVNLLAKVEHNTMGTHALSGIYMPLGKCVYIRQSTGITIAYSMPFCRDVFCSRMMFINRIVVQVTDNNY